MTTFNLVHLQYNLIVLIPFLCALTTHHFTYIELVLIVLVPVFVFCVYTQSKIDFSECEQKHTHTKRKLCLLIVVNLLK